MAISRQKEDGSRDYALYETSNKNVIDVDSTSQQRRVPSGEASEGFGWFWLE